MGNRIQCFFLEPSNLAEASLRRFVYSNRAKCPGKHGYHNASAVIADRVKWELEANGCGDTPTPEMKKDPRWPTTCDCGYAFVDLDVWQCNTNRLFVRGDNGGLVTLHDAPDGAMWYADWLGDFARGPDGHTLVVRTPGGEWVVDAPSKGGGKWTRTGKVPKITATPSILIGEVRNTEGKIIARGYHGFLTDGALIEC